MTTKNKKKEIIKNPFEERYYKQFNSMAKVNFLGFILKDYFKEKLIGKDSESIETAKLKAILRMLDEKFTDQIE